MNDTRRENGGAKTSRRRGSRGSARLAAVQALYEMDVAGTLVDTVLRRFLEEGWAEAGASEAAAPTAAELDRDLFTGVVRGVEAGRSDLDDMIESALNKERTLARLEVVLRAVLRAGAFELSAGQGVPPRVVISEYVDVAHAFFTGSEPGLVNGVLDRLARVLHPDDMKT